ncbi:MAG: agmatinase [Acidobacteriota bacterium]
MSEESIDRAFTARSPYGMLAEPTYSGALSFMRRNYTKNLKGVDVAVTGVPLDLATSNRPGARFGPAGIRKASAQLAWGPPWPWGFDPFEKLAVIDYGDCDFDPGRPDRILAAIEEHARTILDAGVSMLALGGDHFITYPLLRAHAKVHGPLSLVHFDAHTDSWSEDEWRVDHGTMFFHAMKEGLIDPGRSVQIGIRTHNERTHGFTILDAERVHDSPPEATVAEIMAVVGDNKAYLTFDIDCLDPSCAPGTGTPVVGGLTTMRATQILRRLGGVNFIAMDITEVAPVYDVGEITALAAATLALDYLCLRAEKHRKTKPPGS